MKRKTKTSREFRAATDILLGLKKHLEQIPITIKEG